MAELAADMLSQTGSSCDFVVRYYFAYIHSVVGNLSAAPLLNYVFVQYRIVFPEKWRPVTRSTRLDSVVKMGETVKIGRWKQNIRV